MRRLITAVALVLGAVFALTACDKPLPRVTVSGDGTVINLDASLYCFTDSSCREPGIDDLPVLTVSPDSKVIIDVPRRVAESDWHVTALSLDGQTELGNSGTLHDVHVYRLSPGTINGGEAFIAEINEVDGDTILGRWSVVIKVSVA